MLREMNRRTNDGKEHRAKCDLLVNIADSLRWLKYGEGTIELDRNMLYVTESKFSTKRGKQRILRHAM